ncbi:MAG: ABC transporter permease [Longimicrobiales bacterium]
MRRLDGIRLAFEQIRSQKLKSFFAVIGVLIGAMFLVTVISIVEGMNRYMEEDFARQVYGFNTITVRRLPSMIMNPSEEQWREWQRRPHPERDEAEIIRDRLTVPALVAVHSDAGNSAVRAADGTEVDDVVLSAASAEFFRIREYEVGRGRLFNALEDRLGVPVVVLGSETAATLFGARDPLGRSVRINAERFRVIGILEEQGSLFGESLDNRAVAPSRSAMARFTNPHGIVDEILVRTERTEDMAAAQIELEAILRQVHRLRPGEPNDFEIETAEESMSFWNRISRILFIAFPGLVAIALVVGGMVVMNIMLVSVAERTREIGIRKALGARRGDILFQVLVESAVLSTGGAGLGILLGIVIAGIVQAVSPLPAAIALHWMVFAAATGMIVGVLAGLYPASRAAKMDPVVALRQE